MKPTLQSGLKHTVKFEVTRDRTIDFMGEKARVYATPMLVRDVEIACRELLLAHLDARKDVQNIDLMNMAGFCRNCLSNWLKDAADAYTRHLDSGGSMLVTLAGGKAVYVDMYPDFQFTAARIDTFDGTRLLTGASGFYFERDERLYLVTARHVLIDAPSGRTITYGELAAGVAHEVVAQLRDDDGEPAPVGLAEARARRRIADRIIDQAHHSRVNRS